MLVGMSIFLAHDFLHVGQSSTHVVGLNAFFSYYSCNCFKRRAWWVGAAERYVKLDNKNLLMLKQKQSSVEKMLLFSYKTCYMFISLIDVIVASGLFDRFCIYPGNKRDLNV